MNWVDALRKAVLEMGDGEFSWGEHDCCQFARTYYRLMTGVDVAEGLEYDSAMAAGRIVASHGSIEAMMRSLLGDPRDGEAEAGDVVLCEVNTEGDLAAGVYNGGEVFTFDPHLGMCRKAGTCILEAWPCRSE